MSYRGCTGLLAAVLGVALVACYVWDARQARLSDDEVDICETVIRNQIGSLKDPMLVACFVRINGLNAPARLLKRFKGETPAVKTGGGADVGGPNAVLSITSINRVDRDSVILSCTYFIAGEDTTNDVGAGMILSLARQGQKWVVEGVRLIWVS